ncbi:MAG: NapH/MauN family ferredoxin-type protein [Gammaproteobacteria bacterium]|nr:NapH/MauN family ferredoxin-type protein [Gammaproteobacteria bacterium]
MGYFKRSLQELAGKRVDKPLKRDLHPDLHTIYEGKKGTLSAGDLAKARLEHHKGYFGKWRKRRWATLIAINLLFVVSYYFDIQILEGALTASRFVGFHMADLNSALQVMLAYKVVVLNLVIGTVTVFMMWVLLGGRTFCSWVCPYHLLAEWAEVIHLRLEAKGWVNNHTFHRGVRTVLYFIFALLALITGYTVFETLSPTGILSRALIYGPGLALIWVGLLLLLEIFYSRRLWCRYACPIGITYGVVGLLSPLRVTYNATACHHEGDCRKVCLVPHVLDLTIRGRAPEIVNDVSADCTRCGLCVDICPTDSLHFEFKGLKKLL